MADNIVTGAMIKALDELSGKLLWPVTVLATCIDYAEKVSDDFGVTNFWLLYIACFFTGSMICILATAVIEILCYYWSGWPLAEHIDFEKILSVFLIPLGVMAILPEYFTMFKIEIPLVTGIALLVWGFALTRGKS